MNPWKADFDELYRRHLCRHSQFGLNVAHLIAVGGAYLALFGIALAIPGGKWLVGGVLCLYGTTLAFNLPFQLWLVNAFFVGALLALFFGVPAAIGMPQLSVWVHVILLLFWHRCQVWQHRYYRDSTDMNEFVIKYPKGPALFVLLAVYELPILLQYLVFQRRPSRSTRSA